MQPLLDWYDAGHRDLPWRSEPAPYRVWVSEIMLQQTRVEAVRGYFSRWMNALPDIPASRRRTRPFTPSSGRGSAITAACATCTVQRSCCAKNTAANCLLITTGCLLCPASASTRQAAVASIAFGLPFRRWTAMFCVAARLDNDFTPITDAKFKKQTRERFAALMPSDRPGDLNQSLMELGATVLSRRTAHRTVTTARFSISARAFTAETRLCCRSEPQKGAESGNRTVLCCALRSACRSAAETQKGLLAGLGAAVARWPSLAGRAARGAHRNGLERAKAALSAACQAYFSPMWSGMNGVYKSNWTHLHPLSPLSHLPSCATLMRCRARSAALFPLLED